MTENDSEKRKNILEAFKKWLDEQKIPNREIAGSLHISQPHLVNILAGRRQASPELLAKIETLINYKSLSQINNSDVNKEHSSNKELAEELRKWLSKQEKWKTQKELAGYIQIPYHTLRKYFTGNRFPKGEQLKKLFQITGIELLRIDEIDNNKPPQLKNDENPEDYINRIHLSVQNIQKDVESLKKHINSYKNGDFSIKRDASSHERVAVAFYRLAEELLSFRTSNMKEREQLKKMISSKDIGYVVSFLKALFDEDKFSDFIFFSKYELEGRLDKNETNI